MPTSERKGMSSAVCSNEKTPDNNPGSMTIRRPVRMCPIMSGWRKRRMSTAMSVAMESMIANSTNTAAISVPLRIRLLWFAVKLFNIRQRPWCMEGMVEKARRILMHDRIESFSGRGEGYRNRVDLVFFDGGLGMRESFDSFIDFEHVDSANERINTILSQIRERFVGFDPFIVRTKRGTMRYAVIRSLDSDSVSFVLNRNGDTARAKSAIEEFARTSDVSNVLITYTDPESDVSFGSDFEVVKGSQLLEATLAGARLKVHVQGFFQTNLEMAEAMHRFIQECVSDASGTLIDLYGGVGSFACTLGPSFEHVCVIESHEGSASIAGENLKTNNVRGEAICADASTLERFSSERLTVITDPPRSGMSEKAVRALALRRPERIVYISCNPLIAPRDLAYLKGYRITRVGVFDMFPGTDHFEMVVCLSRYA